MAVSKNGRPYFSKEQYQTARSVSALEYAKQQGYDLVRKGRRCIMREHDSMVFLDDGRWFWNSRGLSGGALEFIQHYEGRSLPEAVLILNDQEILHSVPAQQEKAAAPVFSLPPRELNTRSLVDYLTLVRHLDSEIVTELIAQKRIPPSPPKRTPVGCSFFVEKSAAHFRFLPLIFPATVLK